MPLARMPNFWMLVAASAASAARSMNERFETRREHRERDVLLQLHRPHQALRCRDPPARRRCRSRLACAGLRMATAWPARRIAPLSAGVMPKTTWASSLRPEPTRPARPDDLSRPQRQADAIGRRPADDIAQLEDRFADRHLERGNRASILRPTIIWMRFVAVGLAHGLGGDVLAVAEDGRRGRRSRKISSSRWLI